MPAGPAVAKPTVSFYDDQPFKKDWARVVKDGGIAVTVRNERDEPQRVTVTAFGVPAVGGVTKMKLGPRGVHRVVVPLPAGAEAPEVGDHAGVVLASGETGQLARRRFTLTVAKGKPAPRAEALTAADLTDQTLPATNFLSSVLEPIGPTLVVLVVVLLVALAILARVLWSRGKSLAFAALVLAGLLAVGLLLRVAADVNAFGERDDQSGLSEVSTKSLRVSGVADGTYGVVTNAEADMARLVVEKGRLRPEGLDRAGTYTGKLDLTPGAEKGEATVKVEVRDWWPWAFLVIGIGVWSGYLLRRLFQTLIPRQKVIAEALMTAAEAGRTTPELEGYKNWDITSAVAARVEHLRGTARLDVATAKEELKTFRADLQAHGGLMQDVVSLKEKLDALVKEARAVGVEAPESPAAFDHAGSLLERGPARLDAKAIETRATEVATVRKELEALEEAKREADAQLKVAEELKRRKTGDDAAIEAIVAIEDQLRDHRRAVFGGDLAAAVAGIAACDAELDKIRRSPAPPGIVAAGQEGGEEAAGGGPQEEPPP
ncbi:MAG TPA: hypothetical protein VF587_20140, partial [Solirubrobacteraceae bacterium]